VHVKRAVVVVGVVVGDSRQQKAESKKADNHWKLAAAFFQFHNAVLQLPSSGS
jgi:hypothetical protein